MCPKSIENVCFSSILSPEKFDISNFNPELFSLKNFCSFLIKFKVLKVFFKIESYIWDTFHHQYFGTEFKVGLH